MPASTRARAAVLAAPALAALIGLGACTSGSATSSVSSTTPTTSPLASSDTSAATGSPTDSASAAVSAGASAVGSATNQVAAIAQCLKTAGLPTPTSSNLSDLARLVTDPQTAAALRKCGISIPGVGAASS